MVERKSSSRHVATVSMKTRKPNDKNYAVLARGLSARFTGTNTPLEPLTQDEMERDLRHMEAFSNACTAYAQQYYMFTNRGNNSGKPGSQGGDGPGKSNSQARGGLNRKEMPIIAMPVRIDPEEEKRLQILRQKIQQCEAQREIYEGEYLSLRAHFCALSKKLKTKRNDFESRVAFLQELVQKRARLVALQRVRIQMVRETMLCLRHRLNNPSAAQAPTATKSKEDQADLHAQWTNLDQQWKAAEESISKIKADGGSNGSSTSNGKNNGSSSGNGNKETDGTRKQDHSTVAEWPASFVPKIPPGVPLLLSQLGQQPGHAVAWGTCGAFGAKKDSLVWIHNQIPTQRSDRSETLVGLRSDVARYKQQIAREHKLNRDFQSRAIKMRRENDQLVSMMTLLRSETEAVVARHNVLLESEEAKKASKVLYDEEAMVANVADTDASSSSSKHTEGIPSGSETLPKSSGLNQDDANDGDDEGEDDGFDEYEGQKSGTTEQTDPAAGKRGLGEGGSNDDADANGESSASRSKRRRTSAD
ncbi:unnamed protein product [Pseudo-nitzschia multistriata]|uniref:Uncharacterized protein n=1 Tax=Pseudo-nitzschia multistriata TaxID=183589 RepID=A0A448ZRN7_9STRA|nr:unnamed protein product [Pseudo-nitzschia multistriata]